MKKVFCILGIIGGFVVSSCKKDNVSVVGLDTSYLPLGVGNYWKIDGVDTRTISETKVFDQKTYYAITSSYDTSYVRKENDKIIEYHKGKTSVRFDLAANVNDTWQYRDYTVTLTSKTETIVIGGESVKDCYRFYLDIPAMADDEHAIWLAPGIGFIQQECYGECIGGKNKLKELKLDGIVYKF